MLVCSDAKTEVVERNLLSPHHADVTKIKECWCDLGVHRIQSVDESMFPTKN